MLDAAGAIHEFPIRVYYEDTDAGGVVYYANYLRFAERARTEMLRRLGHAQSALMEDAGEGDAGVVFAVRRCEIDYLRSARLDDALLVRSRLVEMGGASLKFDQEVVREDTPLARLKVRIACIRLHDGRPARLPAQLRSALMSYVNEG